MQLPIYKTLDYCWHMPSLSAVRIVDKAWGCSIYLFEPSVKKEFSKGTISSANAFELSRVRHGDPVVVLGYGESGLNWDRGKVVTIVGISEDDADFPLQVHSSDGTTIFVGLDEVMRFAPARKKYIEKHYVGAENGKKLTTPVKVKEAEKMAHINMSDLNETPETTKKIMEMMYGAEKPKPTLYTAKTIIEKAKEKSKNNPEVLATAELAHEYENLRKKFSNLLEQLKNGANVKNISEEIEKTEEEINEAKRKLEIGYRKFK